VRFTTTVVVFFILLNAFAGALQASGMTDIWDTEPDVNAPTALDRAQTSADNAEATGGALDTLFGLATSLGTVLATIFAGALPAVSMLADLGVPDFFLGYITAPVVIISFVEIAEFLRGIG
jgi:hypothetical protein